MPTAVLFLLLSSILAFAQTPDTGQLFASAIAAQQRGDYPVAIDDYQKLLKLQPKMVEARVNLGAALAHTGRFDDAIAQYLLALPDAPEKGAVHMNLGLAYYKKGDLANASREFEGVRKEKPRILRSRFFLATARSGSARALRRWRCSHRWRRPTPAIPTSNP